MLHALDAPEWGGASDSMEAIMRGGGSEQNDAMYLPAAQIRAAENKRHFPRRVELATPLAFTYPRPVTRYANDRFESINVTVVSILQK